MKATQNFRLLAAEDVIFGEFALVNWFSETHSS